MRRLRCSIVDYAHADNFTLIPGRLSDTDVYHLFPDYLPLESAMIILDPDDIILIEIPKRDLYENASILRFNTVQCLHVNDDHFSSFHLEAMFYPARVVNGRRCVPFYKHPMFLSVIMILQALLSVSLIKKR